MKPILQGEMTLRDYFAIHAPDIALNLKDDATYDEQASERYKFADAMLKARNENPG